MVISGDFNLPDILWDSIDSASGVFIETLQHQLSIKTHSTLNEIARKQYYLGEYGLLQVPVTSGRPRTVSQSVFFRGHFQEIPVPQLCSTLGFQIWTAVLQTATSAVTDESSSNTKNNHWGGDERVLYIFLSD